MVVGMKGSTRVPRTFWKIFRLRSWFLPGIQLYRRNLETVHSFTSAYHRCRSKNYLKIKESVLLPRKRENFFFFLNVKFKVKLLSPTSEEIIDNLIPYIKQLGLIRPFKTITSVSMIASWHWHCPWHWSTSFTGFQIKDNYTPKIKGKKSLTRLSNRSNTSSHSNLQCRDNTLTGSTSIFQPYFS